jgi:hypothetical protein
MAASTDGYWITFHRPSAPRVANQNIITGPNSAPTAAVPCR